MHHCNIQINFIVYYHKTVDCFDGSCVSYCYVAQTKLCFRRAIRITGAAGHLVTEIHYSKYSSSLTRHERLIFKLTVICPAKKQIKGKCLEVTCREFTCREIQLYLLQLLNNSIHFKLFKKAETSIIYKQLHNVVITVSQP